MKRKLSKQDLKKTLAELGFKEGDELILPSPSKPNSNEQTNEDEGDDTGGSNPPENKPKPDKP